MLTERFIAAVYLTDYTGADSAAIEEKAAQAASEMLASLEIDFDEAMAAEGARCQGEAFDQAHAAAYAAAQDAAHRAVQASLAGTGGFVSLGWR